MCHDVILAVMNVVLAFGCLGSYCLITREHDTFTKAVFGWFFSASWSLAVIMPTLDHGQISDLRVMVLMVGLVFLPAFPFGYIVARLKHGADWVKVY